MAQRKYKQYSDDEIIKAVQSSTSIAQALVMLGIKPAGGSHYNFSKRIKRMGLDTSHFLGQGHMKGKKALNRKTPDEILVFSSEKNALAPRPKTAQLRRALKEIGRPYVCEMCKIGDMYNGMPLTLEIDHEDGNYNNNLRENLRFLCPNCHSQTQTYSRRSNAQ